jgi:hypothetical protein
MLAIWRRSVRALLPQNVAAVGSRVRLMQPDKDHVHHRVLRDTMNQRTAAIMLYAASALLVMVGLGGTLLKGRAPGLFLIAFIVAIFVVVRHLARVELWDTGRLFSSERHAIRQGLLVPLYIVIDIFSLCGVWLYSRWLEGMPLGRAAFLSNLPLFVVPVFIFLVISKTYWRVWSRAQIRDFALLVVVVVAGTATGLGLVWLFKEAEPHILHFAIHFATFSVFPLAGVRLLRDCKQGVLQSLERRVLLERPTTQRFLAYGGGLRFRSYLRELTERSGKNDRVIVGIVDDDIQMKGRVIAGHVVLGGGDELAAIVRDHRISGVIITCLMEPEKRRAVVDKLGGLGVRVTVWSCEEQVLAAPKEREAR